ncbi:MULTISPECIES: glucose PTS transporter subunit EIIB [unclassified Arthrobacter]|uniref:glucose PTS transporter subunit EIIB n=1 Tax=unclassified Arthrobacter TaxID=235627 RepID=UPI0027D815DD|nr:MULTISPECIES: glucose PTS transporter subunit EIIB [unclassified Arthrobacter]
MGFLDSKKGLVLVRRGRIQYSHFQVVITSDTHHCEVRQVRLSTSGRTKSLKKDPAVATRKTTRGVDMSKAEIILAALGGADNVEEIEGCITRLRTEVIDAGRVDEAALKAAGAHGVMMTGTVVQVVVGPEAESLAEDIQDLM